MKNTVRSPFTSKENGLKLEQVYRCKKFTLKPKTIAL